MRISPLDSSRYSSTILNTGSSRGKESDGMGWHGMAWHGLLIQHSPPRPAKRELNDHSSKLKSSKAQRLKDQRPKPKDHRSQAQNLKSSKAQMEEQTHKQASKHRVEPSQAKPSEAWQRNSSRHRKPLLNLHLPPVLLRGGFYASAMDEVVSGVLRIALNLPEVLRGQAVVKEAEEGAEQHQTHHHDAVKHKEEAPEHNPQKYNNVQAPNHPQHRFPPLLCHSPEVVDALRLGVAPGRREEPFVIRNHPAMSTQKRRPSSAPPSQPTNISVLFHVKTYA
eukprot:scaffold225_cov235-Pinguiococcus_pyrenoidosus.AAC.8